MMEIIPEISEAYSFPLSTSSMRYHLHAFFLLTFVVQIVNTLMQHSDQSGYWAYILILEGPVMLFNLLAASCFQQWWARKKEFAVDETTNIVLWSYGR
jgi:lipopolysaccharide export LptBFGC system permease protein LptF